MSADQRVAGNDRFRLSPLVPMYNEEASLPLFLDRVVPLVERITPDDEIVCVNDGSSDRTLTVLTAARGANPCIKIVDLTRNFGKETALTAGLDFATGDAVIPLDADLQDPPELIPDLVAKWREGNDMVVAVRRDRSSDRLAKRGSANLFYRVIAPISEVPIPANAGDFRLMDGLRGPRYHLRDEPAVGVRVTMRFGGPLPAAALPRGLAGRRPVGDGRQLLPERLAHDLG